MKQYKVNKIDRTADVATITCWKKAECLSEFTSPWDTAAFKKIEFRALHSEDTFYFQFKVYDLEIHIDRENDSVESIGKSDRVELFFRSDESMLPYYCLEIDPELRVMDFIAYPNKQFLFNWKWPKSELKLHGEKFEDGFIVAGSISKQSLKNLELIKDDVLEVGIFRAKYNKVSEGEFGPTWITWVDPKTEQPNFHIKSSFGQLILA